LKQEGNQSKRVIFYDDSRCDINIFENDGVDFIKYTRWNFLKLLISSFLRRPDEVCVPHFRGGRLIRFYAKYAKKISVIDDGLDTFRELPRNIVVSDFKFGSNFYTFKYDTSVASWLNEFNLVKVCELNEIAKSSKKILDLNDFDAVLIESPGIEALQLSELKFSRVFIVKHSNPNKNITTLKSCSSSVGSDFALEKSIENFRGTLIVGESMTAVYALMLKSPSFKLAVAINQHNKKNLVSLINLINKKKFAELLVVDN